MTCVAVFKWAMNPKDERLGVDGSIKWAADRPEVGDDDHAAIQVAQDANPGEPAVGVTMASGEMAFGAARGIENTIAIEGLDALAQPTEIAAALASAIKGIEDVTAVAIGDCAWQPMVPSLLAANLGWPCILAVDAVRPEGDGLVVTRRFGSGTQDIAVSGPVVMAVAARREEENKPGMRAILTARKKPVEKVNAQADNASVFEVSGVHEPEARASKIFDGSDPEAAVAQLVSALQSEGVL